MTFRKFITAFLISVMIAASGWAQVRIPTDTTTQVEEDTVKYGPTTTRYFFQRDLQYNRLTEQTIDTTQIGVHNFSIVANAGQWATDPRHPRHGYPSGLPHTARHYGHHLRIYGF